MKKKVILGLLVTLVLLTNTGCFGDKTNDDASKTVKQNTTVNENTKKDGISFSIQDAQEVLKNYFNNEEGINFNYLDTVTVTENNVSKKYYKIDVRHHNGAGTNSRLDIYYIIADKDVANKNGNGIYDSAAFKNKFNVE